MKILLLTVLQSLFALLGEKTMNTDFTITVQEHATQPVTYTGTLAVRRLFLLPRAFGRRGRGNLPLDHPADRVGNVLRALADACEVTEETRQGVTTLTFVPKERVAIDLITMVVKRLTNGDKQYAPATITIKEGLRTTKVQFRNLGYSDEVVDFVQHAEGAYVNDVR